MSALAPIPLFLLVGQSNMAGRGTIDELPQPFRAPVSRVLYDYVCSFGADRGEPFESGGAYRSDGWSALAPCRKHPSTEAPHFGPEIGFAERTIALIAARMPTTASTDRAGDTPVIAIIKHGRGGTNLHSDWDPAAESGRRLYHQMIEQYRARATELDGRGPRFAPSGLCWFQGEGDTLDTDSASLYAERLTAWIARIRSDLSAPSLPFVAAQIKPGADTHPRTGKPWMVYSDVVRHAIEGVMLEDPYCALVETDDLGTSDLVHLDSDGLLEVGRRMADAVDSLRS